MPDDGEDRQGGENVYIFKAKPKKEKKKKSDSIEATELAVGHTLREAPELHEGGMLRFDEFSGRIMVARPIPRPDVDPVRFKPHELSDVDITHLIEWLQAHDFTGCGRIKVEAAVQAEAHRNRFSAVQERFNAFPAWDREERLSDFLIHGCGVGEEDDLEFLQGVSRAFFISICARVFRPGCKVDTMPVFEGPQSGLKSTMLRQLALNDEWFSDNLPHNLSSKDAKQHLAGKLIIEMSEIEQLERNSDRVLKQFLSMQEDRYRPPYGHHEISQPRQCVFAGTTNDENYLRDITGNRRYWPIRAVRIDLDYIHHNLEQVYAEAIFAYRAGEPWWFEGAREEAAKAVQESRRFYDAWEEIAAAEIEAKRTTARKEGKPDFDIVTSDTLFGWYKITVDKQDSRLTQRAGKIMKLLGGERCWIRVGGTIRRGFRFKTHFKE